jgi:hypothetical protein
VRLDIWVSKGLSHKPELICGSLENRRRDHIEGWVWLLPQQSTCRTLARALAQ